MNSDSYLTISANVRMSDKGIEKTGYVVIVVAHKEHSFAVTPFIEMERAAMFASAWVRRN